MFTSKKKKTNTTIFFNNYRKRNLISYIFDFLTPIEYFRISANKILFKILKERNDFPKNSLITLKKNLNLKLIFLSDIYIYFQKIIKISQEKAYNYIINFIFKNNIDNKIYFDKDFFLIEKESQEKKIFLINFMENIKFHKKIGTLKFLNITNNIDLNLSKYCLRNIENLFFDEEISEKFLKNLFEQLIPKNVKKINIFSLLNNNNIKLFENFISQTKLNSLIIFGNNIISSNLLKSISQSIDFGSSLKMINSNFKVIKNEELDDFIESLDKKGIININIIKPINCEFDFISKLFQIYSKEKSFINTIICQNEKNYNIPFKLNYKFGNIAIGFKNKTITFFLQNNIKYKIKNGKYIIKTGEYTLENEIFKQFYFESVKFNLDLLIYKDEDLNVSISFLFQYLLFEELPFLNSMTLLSSCLTISKKQLKNFIKFNNIKELKFKIELKFIYDNFGIIQDIIKTLPFIEKIIFQKCSFYHLNNEYSFESMIIGNNELIYEEIANSNLKEIHFNQCLFIEKEISKIKYKTIENTINNHKKTKTSFIKINHS